MCRTEPQVFDSDCLSGNIPLAADWSFQNLRGWGIDRGLGGESASTFSLSWRVSGRCVRPTLLQLVWWCWWRATPPHPQSTWATLFLSRKPESNSSHMSVITVESDETLMSLSVFPSLSLCVSFSLFLSVLLPNCCAKKSPRPRVLLKYNVHSHKSHEEYMVWPELLAFQFLAQKSHHGWD